MWRFKTLLRHDFGIWAGFKNGHSWGTNFQDFMNLVTTVIPLFGMWFKDLASRCGSYEEVILVHESPGQSISAITCSGERHFHRLARYHHTHREGRQRLGYLFIAKFSALIQRGVFGVLFLVFAGFLIDGCGRESGSQRSVVGTWVGEMPQIEWGPMAYELTLKKTGEAHLIVFHGSDRDAVIHEERDTYSLKDQQIIFGDLFGGGAMHVSFEEKDLILSVNDKILYQMHPK